MQIQQISVTGLFGIFDHVIPLNMNDRITIVHGPNGFGKTAMLRLINGLFNSQYSIFWNIPFHNFQIVFDNKSRVEIIKERDELEIRESKEQITFNFYDSNGEKLASFLLEPIHMRRGINSSIGISGSPPTIRRINGKSLQQYNSTGEVASIEIINPLDGVISRFKLQNEPEWLTSLKQNTHVRLIESQRLLNVVTKRSTKIQSSVYPVTLSTVAAYSSELAQLMRNKFTEYGVISQSLDRTFPSRLVQRQSSPNLTDEQLRNRLDRLEITRVRLLEVGLLDKTENSDFPVQPPEIDENTKNILSIYVDDVEKKLSVFNDVASKIGLLRKIINAKFAYSYKEMNFDKEKGFVFKTLYSSSVSDSNTLSPTDLSSGEQHELVLLYELLFKVEPKSLVLIDEPELSLHVGWQVQFLKDLQDIVKLADLDILMATHSPDIIQDRWDLTVELKGQQK